MFDVRIEIVDVVASSLLLELQASGGRGYLQNAGSDFIRRWREGAFFACSNTECFTVKKPFCRQLNKVIANPNKKINRL